MASPVGPPRTAPSRRPSGWVNTPVSMVTPATSPVTTTASCGTDGVSSSGSTVTAVDGKVNTPTATGSTTSQNAHRDPAGTPRLSTGPPRRSAGASVSGTAGSNTRLTRVSATCTR